MLIDDVIAILSAELPAILRWGSSIAKTLRQYNISLTNKSTGYATTDALTLADITIQELIVGALRDMGPTIRACKIEAEEANGPLNLFSSNSDLAIAIDPIDGTKQFRDHSGNGYAIMVHVRDASQVYYSLCIMPETGAHGTWLEAKSGHVVTGPDDPLQPARLILNQLTKRTKITANPAKKIYMINFLEQDSEKAALVNSIGLDAVLPDDMPGSIYPLLASGEFAGSLIHTPNIYDYPVSMHIAREFGGDSLWVHNNQPVNFQQTWLDERAGMLRLPGIIATSPYPEVLQQLTNLAQCWDQNRYRN